MISSVYSSNTGFTSGASAVVASAVVASAVVASAVVVSVVAAGAAVVAAGAAVSAGVVPPQAAVEIIMKTIRIMHSVRFNILIPPVSFVRYRNNIL
jgi:hypothetical protein